jgi:hypothetical protein
VARNVPEAIFPWDEADRMFTLLVKRAAELSDCKPGSPEEEEFDRWRVRSKPTKRSAGPTDFGGAGARFERTEQPALSDRQPIARTLSVAGIPHSCSSPLNSET